MAPSAEARDVRVQDPLRTATTARIEGVLGPHVDDLRRSIRALGTHARVPASGTTSATDRPRP